MVLYYKVLGLIVSLSLLLAQLPVYISGLLVQRNLTSIPGMFSGLFTVIMLVLIHLHQMKMQRAHKKTQHLFEQTAKALVNAIDAKDTYTHGHSSRVAEYSRRLAEMSYKNPAECDEIYYTALLHDVGKIGVPSSIINKAGKLTEDEYETVKSHPAMGAQILDTINEYPFLSVGAHWHHERYDGKGYPDGLKGEEIPEIARLISVADAYDAMTSIRSYRDPITQDRVREEIVKGLGTQFDPK
ncbi:MAG: HD-GYP domain-containing protein, partial [Ruminiclostridium sp.]|nr:HD-GYP domain-containing protein [Ruminiclostridium sp.]